MGKGDHAQDIRLLLLLENVELGCEKATYFKPGRSGQFQYSGKNGDQKLLSLSRTNQKSRDRLCLGRRDPRRHLWDRGKGVRTSESLMSWVSFAYTHYLRASQSPKETVLTPHVDFLGSHEEAEKGEKLRLSFHSCSGTKSNG